MDFKKAFEQAQRSVTNSYDGVQSNVLDRLGLEPRRSTMDLLLPVLGIFGVGLAVGSALGVIFAPKQGVEFRNDLKHRISDLRDRSVEQLEDVRTEFLDAVQAV